MTDVTPVTPTLKDNCAACAADEECTSGHCFEGKCVECGGAERTFKVKNGKPECCKKDKNGDQHCTRFDLDKACPPAPVS